MNTNGYTSNTTQILWILLLLLLSSCWRLSTTVPNIEHGPGNTAILLTHSPVHPKSNQVVIFKSLATAKALTMRYDLYSLSVSGDEISHKLIAKDIMLGCEETKRQDQIQCIHEMKSSFPDNSLVTIKSQAILPDGRLIEEAYSFAAGNYPLKNSPIPIRYKGNDLSNRIDIIFIPDKSLASIREQLQDVVEKNLFKYQAFKQWRGLYNLYYHEHHAVFRSNTAQCGIELPNNLELERSLLGTMDAIVVLHDQSGSDVREYTCKDLPPRLASRINSAHVLAHELGHAVFDLQDEYCCDGGYAPQSCYPNLWSSINSCQSYAEKLKIGLNECRQITSTRTQERYWHLDPTRLNGKNACLMSADYDKEGADYGHACSVRIEWRYDQCRQGGCFPSTLQECP